MLVDREVPQTKEKVLLWDVVWNQNLTNQHIYPSLEELFLAVHCHLVHYFVFDGVAGIAVAAMMVAVDSGAVAVAKGSADFV